MPFLDYKKYPASQDSDGTMLGLALLQAAQSGQSVGQGLLGALQAEEKAKQLKAEEDYRKKTLGLRQQEFGLDQQKFAIAQAQAAREAEKYGRTKQAQQTLAGLVGQEGVIPGQDKVPPELLAPLGGKGFGGTGLLGGKLTPEQFRLKAAPEFFASGDQGSAYGLLSGTKQNYGTPQKAIDPNTGKPVFILTDDNGNVKTIDNYQPLVEKGLQVNYSPEGGLEVNQGGYALPGDKNMVPSSKTVNELQGDVTKNLDTLARLDQLAENYSDEYLTYWGQGKGALQSVLNKAGMKIDPKYLTGKTKFSTGIQQLFNQYRKEITGAAASVQELDRLKQSMINEDMPPIEFRAAYTQFRDMIKRSLSIKQKLLAQGIPLGSKEFGARLDAELLSGGGAAQPAQPTASPSAQPAQVRRYNPATGKIE
jgi:hypothetical protein